MSSHWWILYLIFINDNIIADKLSKILFQECVYQTGRPTHESLPRSSSHFEKGCWPLMYSVARCSVLRLLPFERKTHVQSFTKLESGILKNRVCPENFRCIEYIFYYSGVLSNLRLPWKQSCPGIFHPIVIFFIIQDFWATCAYLESRVCPENCQARGLPPSQPRTPMSV